AVVPDQGLWCGPAPERLNAHDASEIHSTQNVVSTAADESTVATVLVSLTTEMPASFNIVLYSDFQCPFCQTLAPSIRELQRNGADGAKVTVQFKNFPLSIHPNAQITHQAAMAAKAQGKFWEMHDVLFSNQQRVQRSNLIGYATKLGLDVSK